ncbi:MAG: hypothetical protein KAR38_01070 [Calditrichia bacterium]|nr:hypothetical protein [Calditrichia bacterium]
MSTKRQIDDFVMWTALLVYAVVWFWAICYYIGFNYWYFSLILTIIYCISHIYEITQKGHCYLSADSSAFPAVFITFIISTSLMYFVGPGKEIGIINFVLGFAIAFFLGHVIALLYSAVLTTILNFLFGTQK